MRRGANDAGQGKRSRPVKVKCTLSAVIMLFIINNHSSDSSIRVCFSKYFIMGGATRVHRRSRRHEGVALYVCLCGP
jgi:hypothetical protein